MYGSFIGNAAAIFYFLTFQAAGVFLVCRFFRREHPALRIVLGSSFGSLLLSWLPVLFAFALGFSVPAHLLSLIPPIAILFLCRKSLAVRRDLSSCKKALRRHAAILAFAFSVMVLWILLLHTHTIRMAEDGSMHCGQCTYGDMNMHLGFITSIANQPHFPPDYSIFPGTRLAYPFLSDSISSSLLVLGASLRLAYILPMVFAFFQIIGIVYIFGLKVLESRAKAVLAWTLYLFNGGLGFVYFLDWSAEDSLRFSDIFTGFYTTPTNLIEHNIRWVNIIADMFLPQRATLFGYAAAIPCMYLLYRGCFCRQKEKKTYFLFAGLMLGALPMIHTHSFMAVGLVSAAWLLYSLHRTTTDRRIHPASVCLFMILFLCLIDAGVRQNMIQDEALLVTALSVYFVLLCYGVFLLIRHCRKNGIKPFLHTWGIFLAAALLPAVPQLLFWTFGQVAEGGFVRGHFGWGNQGDLYLWFYLKNIGMPLLLLFGAVCQPKKKTGRLLLPAAVIWFLAELIVFTPNTYDNNKLLYIAYLLIVFAVSDYAVDVCRAVKGILPVRPLAAVVLSVCCFSAVLTLGREIVSDYQIYSSAAVSLASYIEEETDGEDVFLTNTRHVNEIAALTGRSIVCGADTFLYFHGIDTSERREDLRRMYESPADADALFAQYQVSYVVISSYETSDYAVDEAWFDACCHLVFEEDDVRLYALH